MSQGIHLSKDLIIEFHLPALAGSHILAYEPHAAGQHLDGAVLRLEVFGNWKKEDDYDIIMIQ